MSVNLSFPDVPRSFTTSFLIGFEIGNGTFPIRTTRQTPSPLAEATRSVIQVNARPTPSKSLTRVVAAAAAPEQMESYQEFTLYVILKRWMDIIVNG